jgi:uncharacterized repeat protein (TIGR01451 family)
MHTTTNILRRTGLAVAALAALLALAPAARAQAPDFDAIGWKPLDCGAGDPAGDETPSAVDLVGDAAHLSAYYAHDGSYVYFRFRVNGDPGGSGGFASYAWTALMQVPSGNAFQYQYELSLDGKSDTVEVWANTNASDIDFSPLFNDPAEVKLFSQNAATTPLARHLVAGDGSAFGGDPDYFVDFAVPVATLVAKGVIASAADLDAALFFPATSANANNYNKGHLDCPFSPGALLAIDKSVAPAVVPAESATPVTYTIAVRNDGATLARGVVIEDPSLPSYFGTPSVSVTADDPGITSTVVSTRPLAVRVPDLPVGKTVTVTLSATASPTCGDNTFVNVATAFATNAPSVQDDATLTVNLAPAGCAACASDADCDDANACTADTCVAGACSSSADPSCAPCAADADCADDGNPCTTTTCTAGACTTVADPSCTTCATDAECDDHDACTSDACVAGMCVSTTLATCTPNPPEDCHNGIDDDGDGIVDCHDPDCADDPGCAGVEICGDCIDNDGDGLTDYDDPDCCGAPQALVVRRMMLQPTPKKTSAKRLRLNVRSTGFDPAAVDPMHSDTILQVSSPSGMILCQHIPAAAWTHRNPRSFRFLDKTGTVAGGLKRARFAMKRSGRVAFRTVGKQVALGATDGHDVKVTVGVGGQCSQSTAELRTKGLRMVLP